MLELPDEFLNFYYSQEKFYFANKNQQPVGIIDFNPNRGLIRKALQSFASKAGA
jgi:hypothetical protein